MPTKLTLAEIAGHLGEIAEIMACKSDNEAVHAAIEIVKCYGSGEFAEVVHGEWIRKSYEAIPHCSNCGRISIETGSYCRICGAKMDGGKNHETD